VLQCAAVYRSLCVCAYLFVYVCVRVCVRSRARVSAFVYMKGGFYVGTSECVCVYICMHVYIYI